MAETPQEPRERLAPPPLSPEALKALRGRVVGGSVVPNIGGQVTIRVRADDVLLLIAQEERIGQPQFIGEGR